MLLRPDSPASAPPHRPWSLSRRFAATGGLVMLIAMLAVGWFVTRTIRDKVVDSAAATTALMMESIIAPLAQDLTSGAPLSIGPVRALDELIARPPLAGRVVAVKIWMPDGRLAYASSGEATGEVFAPTPALQAALAGRVAAELDALDEEESRGEAALGLPLMEVYSPVHEAWTGRVVAAVEFYENAAELEAALAEARLQSWAGIVVATFAIGAALWGIVASGSRTIEDQKVELERQVVESRAMTAENRRLRLRAERAARGASEITEAGLRRAAADLHDGPAQLVGLAVLRLDALARAEGAARQEETGAMRLALGEALREIRAISSGLSLPDLAPLDLAEVARQAVEAHEAMAGRQVEARIAAAAARPAPDSVKTCLYRFLQEGLSNALRHAADAAVAVRVEVSGDRLSASVTNGAAPIEARAPGGSHGMAVSGGKGLPGLKERIESQGGDFAFSQHADGARLVMELDLAGGERNG